MPTIGVNTVVLHQGQVLLIKREDFEIWALPGGGIDTGESLAQAAIRETKEETGLDIALTHLVGVYSRPDWIQGGDHTAVFRGKPQSEVIHFDKDETLAAGYFSPEALPSPFLWWHRRFITDALAVKGGAVAWSQEADWPFDQSQGWSELLHVRDQSKLSRAQFFEQQFSHYFTTNKLNDHLEVG